MNQNRIINVTLIIKTIILFIVITCNISCNDTLERYIVEEQWIIKEIIIDETNFRQNILVNIIVFEESGKCRVPLEIKDIKLMNKEDRHGTWSLDSENFEISINNVQEYINGTFEFCFKKDDKLGAVYMILKSDKVYIKAYKGNYGTGYNSALPRDCISW